MNEKDISYCTPLHWACYSGHTDVAKLWIDQGVDIHVKYKIGWTPLHTACYCGRKEIVRLVMIHGVDWLIANKECRTPVDLAIKRQLNNVLVFLETIIDQLPDSERKKIQAWRFRQELSKTS